jgi:purine-binding chemotaxis protein CheW
VVVKASGPKVVPIGDEAVLRFEVRNDGSWPATATRARIQFPSGLSSADGETIETELGDLAPGDSFELSPRVRGIRAGPWEVTAEATCAEQAHAACAIALAVTAPVLGVRLIHPPRCLAGHETELQVEVTNTGTAPATTLAVGCSLPEQMELVGLDKGGMHYPDRQLVLWRLASLSPGHTHTLALRLKGHTPGDYGYDVEVRADRARTVRARGTIANEVDEGQGRGLLERFVALMNEEDTPALSPQEAPRLAAERAPTRETAGERFVLFSLGEAHFAVPIENVLEIAALQDLTPLPNAPDWMAGVTNRRGDVVSIVDFRAFLGLGPAGGAPARRTLIVRASREDLTTGLVVDQVREIRRLPADLIRPPAGPLEGPFAAYLRGVAEHKGHLLIVLDLDRLLLSDAMRQFEPV